ncbi:RagB/SusD family nutrient uptake outer membrane protein [Hoylesella buccalis]|uniref:RagB/SusD family nutrient uptake outer membrane protein n=1 Tax=Hoylesella buccalis TaxID=28127 RepID=UPI001D14F952|nr:RagB/SusD family nutrient uptake outer membrane protein [Hoylesella buccalis]UEA63967.1 RagB/SusD family nutrient uptake outer membrane protein [Hoylesella buccalis]UWP48740.1 RagB/SusD family nutrient uptake outer membrane protein [Hoylesella buccalis ATCC 35310]
MKRIKYITIGLLTVSLALTTVSCSDYLKVDKYFKDIESIDHIFSDKESTMQWLSFCYSRLQGDNIEVGHSDICPTNFSDDQTFNEGEAGRRYRRFKLGEYGYGYAFQDYYTNSWPWAYDAIRQASIFLMNAHATEELNQKEIDDLKGQARFLRAYFYWLLIRKYGPVPIMPTEGADYTKSYDELSYPRNTFDDCVDFIAEEMILAAKDLPEKRDNQNIARPTKGAALAVRAKVLTYAASPLYNGNTEMADFVDKQGNQLISQTYDETKWAKAAAACRDLIDYADQTGIYRIYTTPVREKAIDNSFPATITPPVCEPYSSRPFPEGWADIDPFESYRSVFNGELYAAENPELIFTRGKNGDKGDLVTDGAVTDLVRHQLPSSCGGWNIHGMTQKQCDAYDMADGTPYSREAVLEKYGNEQFTTKNNAKLHPYDHLPNNGIWLGYANREPRFYASVAYSGSIWYCSSSQENIYKNQQVFYYRGEGNGRVNSNERWVNTGIGIMKYVHPDDCAVGNGSFIKVKVEPTIRYADILLLYAEALNNLTTSHDIPTWDGKQTYTVSRDIQQMKRGVMPVRMRAGVPDYSEQTYASRDAFFKAIVHERQVELFNENQRFFDLRRWKIAEENEAEQVYGCNTNMSKEYRTQFYVPVRVPNLQTSFSRKQYFWPITYTELKRNRNMTQAPGWENYD